MENIFYTHTPYIDSIDNIVPVGMHSVCMCIGGEFRTRSLDAAARVLCTRNFVYKVQTILKNFRLNGKLTHAARAQEKWFGISIIRRKVFLLTHARTTTPKTTTAPLPELLKTFDPHVHEICMLYTLRAFGVGALLGAVLALCARAITISAAIGKHTARNCRNLYDRTRVKRRAWER